MTKIARVLPLITVAAWTITLAIPMLDSSNPTGPRLMVSSSGGYPFHLAGVEPVFILAWAGVVGCATSVWVLRSLKGWSVVTILVAVLLGALLVATLINPPSLIWDGQDAQGRAIGGEVTAHFAAGGLAWILGIGALFAAGIHGLLEETRREQNRLTD